MAVLGIKSHPSQIIAFAVCYCSTGTWSEYLRTLFTMMLAYVMAGIHAVVGSIRHVEGFSFEDDLNNFFLCPLQTAMDYYNRAEAMSNLRPERLRLQWRKAQDELDRTMWVHEFQHSRRTFGQFIKYVM